MNILLDDTQREIYKDVIKELHDLCPVTIRKKIPRANIQQAFMLDAVRNVATKQSKLLCVGSFEDTACESLQKLGYNVTAIDPAVNMDLDTFCKTQNQKFDVVFSTSVIEHVKDDEKFLNQMCSLLAEGGWGILTCDFNNEYKEGDKKPVEDYRFYTEEDLLARFAKILKSNNCSIEGDIDYGADLDFEYGGCKYSFATYTFRKKSA